MRENINPIAEMYRQWRNISDKIEELRCHDYLDCETPLRFMADVLESDFKDCVKAMRKVADLLELDGKKKNDNETDEF